MLRSIQWLVFTAFGPHIQGSIYPRIFEKDQQVQNEFFSDMLTLENVIDML